MIPVTIRSKVALCRDRPLPMNDNSTLAQIYRKLIHTFGAPGLLAWTQS